MRSAHALKAVLIASTALAAVSGCASNTRSKELAYVERPVETIYNDATHRLDRREWALAAQQFDEVQRQHPYSPWAARAMLMSAYSRYRQRDYEKAISAANDYISLHPGGDGAPYAYYLIAICHFDQIVDVGREQARSELALDALKKVTALFPDTEYARDAAVKTDMVRDQLAGKEMEIGRYYLRRNEHLAAINRFKNVLKTYDGTSHVPEALERLVESYLSIGLVSQAQAAAAVLGYNYPGSEWYTRAYKLMQGEGVQLVEKPNGHADFNLIDRLWKSLSSS
ncbi:MAG TPA: outer membrane protein assembly factor BamD [Hyphomonadaceae bacterium]|nr:outer membrane protein assembly factor BamD [Hyphomonadaceae bacterium]